MSTLLVAKLSPLSSFVRVVRPSESALPSLHLADGHENPARVFELAAGGWAGEGDYPPFCSEGGRQGHDDPVKGGVVHLAELSANDAVAVVGNEMYDVILEREC